MSSFLPNVIVAEALKKLNLLARIGQADLDAKVAAGLQRLADYQHDDGGWGWWKEDDSRVFMSAYVVGGLAQASRSYGLDAPSKQMLAKGEAYLQSQLSLHPRMMPDLRAYVVYSLSEGGATGMAGQLDALWSRRYDLSSEGLALTGLAMLRGADKRSAQIATLLESKAQQSGSLAYWPSVYNPLLDLYYDNNAESTAFALRFLTHAKPGSPLLGGAAQWLVLNRSGGEWQSTEQTAMVLFGLVDYLAASHELTADFDVDVLSERQRLGITSFHLLADAVSGATLQVDVACRQVAAAGNTVGVVKNGAGRATGRCRVRTTIRTESSVYQEGQSFAEPDSRLLQAGCYAEGRRRGVPARSVAWCSAAGGYAGGAHCGERVSGEVPSDRGSDSCWHRVCAARGFVQDSGSSFAVGVLVYAARVP